MAIRVDRRVGQQSALIIAALFVFSLAIIRAHLQAITVDEANTYFWWVRAYYPWSPGSNNHVLNSLLIWVTTHVFGISVFTVRMPALLGAALYICVCYFLCRSLTERFSLQFPVFICLLYNPFILDFMVAARGYSLANAFLLAAIAIPIWHHRAGGPSLRRSCALASLALGLSFTANFSFAFVDLAVFLAIAIWALGRRGSDSKVRMLAFCALPGLFVAILICGYPITHLTRDELWYGAHSLREMWHSLIEASLHQLSPGFLGSQYKAMNSFKPRVLPYVGIFCVGQLVMAAIDGSWLRGFRESRRWLGMFTAALAGIVILTVLLHWIAFRFDNLPLPLGRTGIFLLPLCTLIAAAIAGSPARSLISRWLRRGTTTAFFCAAFYSLLCLRVSYFEEYSWDADVKDVYSVLVDLNQNYGARDVAASWMYHSPLNFYRVASRGNVFPEFVLAGDPPPAGKAIYVLLAPYDQPFIDREKLRVIYHGKSTGVVVAVRPDLEPPAAVAP
ncbi:MAG TPA: hypothetical protein VGQ49_16895 [Bryobacteraceae bacterium]|nr:hypothetical protein [Bryobacteraceae bacterium]